MNETPFPTGEGSWFAYVHRPAAVSWLLPRKDSKKVARLISAVSASWEDDAELDGIVASYESCGGRDGGGGAAAAPLSRQASLSNTQSFVFSTCGLTVRQGLYEVGPEIWRVAPFVHCAPDNSAAIAFTGSLLNLGELAARYSSPAGTPKHARGAAAAPDGNNGAGGAPPRPPCIAAALAEAGAGGLARQGSIERSLDLGALTARVVLAMYQQESEIVALSELQGQYAFIILDARKGAFAARDPSGTEALLYRIADDGSAAFASNAEAVPQEAVAPDGEWRELPPGHYISGRTPKLHQFALTPEQLQVREMCEGLGPCELLQKRRSSLDNNGGRSRSRSLEGDLFGMDGLDA